MAASEQVLAKSSTSGPRYEADDCRDWLARAKSNLRLASVRDEAVYSEELCFNAQQAAEKAIKPAFPF